MSYDNNTSGLGLQQPYGPRETQDGVLSGGTIRTDGGEITVTVYAKGEDFGSGTSFDTKAVVPSGSVFVDAVAEVTEAFALGGTTPTLNIGTNGSEGTNYGIELSEANAEATGTYYNATGAGTFGNPLTSDVTIGVALDGTSPTVTSAGALKVVMTFKKI